MRPSQELLRMVEVGDVINQCQSRETLVLSYQKYRHLNHPYVFQCVANKFLIFGLMEEAKEPLIEAARFGQSFPSKFYDDLYLSDSVGQCLSNLMIYYHYELSESLKITSLAYLFLSKCIDMMKELKPDVPAFDSLRTRGRLLIDHEDARVVRTLLGPFITPDPLVISDFYRCSIKNSPHGDMLNMAKQIHSDLEDLSIAGKGANEYSIQEISLLGEKRHMEMFTRLEEKYFNGELDLQL